MNEVDQAVDCFTKGFNCSQAVLSACGPRYGLDRETALKVAGAFGGGMARMGETCGAVTGAFMVIGLKHAKIKDGDDASREKSYKVVTEFVKRFTDQHKSILCRDLLGCDLSTPLGLQTAKDQKLFTTICPKYVRAAAELVHELLEPAP
jgi:C_GCAxxG_C_C family probable redox protein